MKNLELESFGLVEMNYNEIKNKNGGNGVHSGGYTLTQDSAAVGAFQVGVVYGFCKGLYNKLFN